MFYFLQSIGHSVKAALFELITSNDKISLTCKLRDPSMGLNIRKKAGLFEIYANKWTKRNLHRITHGRTQIRGRSCVGKYL